MRTVGVEEELFLVDPKSGAARSVATRILRQTNDAPGSHDHLGGRLEHEVQQQMVETNTAPHADLTELADDIRQCRSRAIDAARDAGVRVIASATSPLRVEPRLFSHPRYEHMAEVFGITAREQLTCACHVHVQVDSDEEGVAALDGIRCWLPVLVALSANSPFWQGADSSYASYRSQAMLRWPTAGPTEVFGSAEQYHATVAAMLDSGVMLDRGMVYFDARLSHHAPTVEIRVPDVCADAADTVLIAALCRGLVETAVTLWRDGERAPQVPAALIRLAGWQAGRYGLEGTLVDPVTLTPRPAADVVADLVELVRPALRRSGDEDLVEQRVDAVLARGNGAMRQRAVLARTGQFADVVADLARLTAGQDAL
ncbi:carboxylate-amine ligase [Mycetocola zhujimingii]|uniref:Putative glutamate--cysteine ligase 2 n=1 Tax=Mycetocola zhujimingii TaxID=2079792 RepID=A0A2U1TBW5_9MICO|nr:glutamate--cysteine ligase [Mycetocola zhujimingii]AWB87610.1 carboxylate--amine ligase [Mycetocola zhujimingii]PWC06392.1 YbdK family carboxylate-amine ligase [Mycetocola zhujimingii]